MNHQFCTLFDRNYLYKGLTLYNSLLEHCPEFTLWILCMDEPTYETLARLNLAKAKLIRRTEFEDDELLKVKPTRTVAEYCWTCTPSLPLYVLKRNPSLETIAYLDADLFFFSNPAPIYEEFADNAIMIIEHRFPEHLKHLEENGIYNVQMLIFRNDASGLECLEWWRERCLEWCYYRLEDGKLGDQKYLDDWPVRFKGVHVLQHKGAGVALWNVMRYAVSKTKGKTFIDEAELVFYHFHGFSMLDNGEYRIGGNSNYPLTTRKIRLIYEPYVKAMRRAVRQVRKVDRQFNHGLYPADEITFRSRLLGALRRIPIELRDLTARLGER